MKLSVVAILLVLCGAAWAQKLEPLTFREKVFDFGSIQENLGDVVHEFVFTNNGNIPVKIISVQASCGCTTPGWSQNPVQPGTSGFVKASFDPKGRPGYFNKSLTVVTDYDPNPIILSIRGEVKSGKDLVRNDFLIEYGSLRFISKAFNFEKVYLNKDPVQKQFEFINAGPKSVELKSAAGPSYLKVEMPTVIGPNAKGIIKVTYDARKRNQFGFASDNIQITTDDAIMEVKLIPVYATLEEYYPVPTAGQAKNGPILLIKQPLVDVGRFQDGNKLEKDVTIFNTGKKVLQIRSLQGNCDCVSAVAEKIVIPPGDSTHIRISLKPQSREGTQLKAITVYSNDPLNSVQRISVQAYQEE